MLKPRKAIDGTRVLTNPERGVYWDLINRMYLLGGAIHDDDRELAGYCNLHLAAYRRVKKSLFEKGKLHVEPNCKIIANHVKNELNIAETLLELRRKSGGSGGKVSGKSRAKARENKDLIEACASTQSKPTTPTPTPSIDSVANATAAGLANVAQTKLEIPDPEQPEHPPPKTIDPMKVVYDAGKNLLGKYGINGKRSGGLIRQWSRQIDGPGLAGVFMEAGGAEHHDIVEFITGCVRNRTANGERAPPIGRKPRSKVQEIIEARERDGWKN